MNCCAVRSVLWTTSAIVLSIAAKGPGNSRWGLFQLVRQAVSQVNRLMLKNARQLDLVLPQHVSQSVPIGIDSFHLTTGQV